MRFQALVSQKPVLQVAWCLKCNWLTNERPGKPVWNNVRNYFFQTGTLILIILFGLTFSIKIFTSKCHTLSVAWNNDDTISNNKLIKMTRKSYFRKYWEKRVARNDYISSGHSRYNFSQHSIIRVTKSALKTGVSNDNVNNKISDLFSSLDLNGDGLVSEEEFIQKCQEEKIMVTI